VAPAGRPLRLFKRASWSGLGITIRGEAEGLVDVFPICVDTGAVLVLFRIGAGSFSAAGEDIMMGVVTERLGNAAGCDLISRRRVGTGGSDFWS
jgi:hypothetical protein